MMGLDILPNHSNSALQSHPPLRASSSSDSYTPFCQTLAQNRQQGRTHGLLEAGTGFCGSTHVVAVARGPGGSSSANSGEPVLQQQGDGELDDMLEHFLQSFEQHVDSCTAREEEMIGCRSCTEASDRRPQTTEQQRTDKAETPVRHSKPHNTPSKHAAGTLGKDRAPARRKRRTKYQYLFSLEKKRVKVRKPASSSDAKTKIIQDEGDRQLKLIPVVKLERSGPLPVSVRLQRRDCQTLGVKVTNISLSSVLMPLIMSAVTFSQV